MTRVFECEDGVGRVSDIPAAEVERLKAVFARLSSPHFGEAAAASGAIMRILARYDLGPEYLVSAVSEEDVTDEASEVPVLLNDIDTAMQQGMNVSAWEVIFIRQLRNTSRVSPKQVQILNQIHERALGAQV